MKIFEDAINASDIFQKMMFIDAAAHGSIRLSDAMESNDMSSLIEQVAMLVNLMGYAAHSSLLKRLFAAEHDSEEFLIDFAQWKLEYGDRYKAGVEMYDNL